MDHHGCAFGKTVLIDQLGVQEHPELPSPFCLDLEFHVLRNLLPCKDLAHSFNKESLPILREEVKRAHGQDLVLRVSRVFAHDVIHGEELPLDEIDLVNSRGCMIDELPVFFLAFAEGFFGFSALGDVPHDSSKSARLIFFVPDEGDGGFNKALAPVFSYDLPIEGMARVAGPVYEVEALEDFLRIVLVHVVSVVHPDQFVCRVTQDFAHGRIEESEVACQINLEVALIHMFEDTPVFLLAFSECPFCLLALRHVLVNDELTAICEGLGSEGNVFLFAVFAGYLEASGA